MSKYVKNLITEHLRNRLQGVNDAVLVNVVGLPANTSHKLRTELRTKNIQLMVVKNSLAARAAVGTPLAAAFDDLGGSTAVCWGSEDIVSLAKEISRLLKVKEYERLESRGGVMDGARLSPKMVEEVGKWPSRQEQLSMLVGQILGPGAQLAGQIVGPGGALASQIQEKAKEAEGGPENAAAEGSA